MGLIVDPDETEDVPDGNGNFVTLRAMMTAEVAASIEDAMHQVRTPTRPQKRKRGKVLRKGQVDEPADESVLVEVHSGTIKLLLLEKNVRGWSGPDFVFPKSSPQRGQPIPCTPENVRRFANLRDPFWLKVLDRIDELNNPPLPEDEDEDDGTDPNAHAANASTVDGTAALRQFRVERQAS